MKRRAAARKPAKRAQAVEPPQPQPVGLPHLNPVAPFSSYDQAKDIVLYRRTAETDENNMLEASVRSYDGGEPRLQLGRYYRKTPAETWRYFTLRRLSLGDGRLLLMLAEGVLKDAASAVAARAMRDEG